MREGLLRGLSTLLRDVQKAPSVEMCCRRLKRVSLWCQLMTKGCLCSTW